MNTIFIGIAGGTGSGKTTLTEHLAQRFGPDISVVHHDNYYKRQDCPFEERCKQNYDHPDAFDTELMVEDLKRLKAGETIHCPVYDYTIHNRTDKTIEIKPTKVVIVEGILIFQNKALRDLLDIKIFVETDADVRILRRALRDVEERGRSMQSVVEQYLATVKPMHEQFVEPTRKYADIVVLEGGHNLVALDLILWPRWLRRTVCVVLVAGLLVLGTILTLMGIRAAYHPDGTRPVTVIVLGCQVRPDGTPSRMLRDRIQAAYDYLAVHEEAVCVASGGQNDREPTIEARCIRDTLVAMGIDPDRIYLEDASTSTEENLAFSAEVIRREGLPTEVAIASDNFHQLRAGVWAEKDGLTPYSLGCASIWMLSPGYWAREAAALLYMGATGAL